jgi:PAS domain S-box-containing protein
MLEQYIKAIEQNNIISKTDTEGIITFVNDEFCKISGYSREELVGQNHNIVRDPSVNTSTFELLWNVIKSKKTYKATVKNRAKDGSVFYVNTTIIPILDEHENIEEYIAIRYDVTQEVLLKKELEQKDKELEELNQTLEKRVQKQTQELQQLNNNLEKKVQEEIAKNEQKQKVMFWQSRLASLGQMLANIAHQWRQPLTELNLTIFNMKKSSLTHQTKDVQELYSQSKDIIKNMSNTIDDFTNFFNPSKDKKLFSLNASITEAIQISERIIKDEHIFIKINFVDIMILGMSNELTQIIINLIQNSKDAFIYNQINQKEIKIVTRNDATHAIIEVIDNAGGISKENIEKVFEPYFTTKHTSAGTGLGLFMSKMICQQAFEGSIEFENNTTGVTFTIKIPLNTKMKNQNV